MEFGTLIFPKPDTAARDVKLAEDLGFSHAWMPDSHMIWADTYACMALAAVVTTRIKLGTGVAVAANRIPPVTVHSIATINALAPGRIILGFGTGHTGRRVMGLPPVRHDEFRAEVRVLNDLLRHGESEYEAAGRRRKLRFLHREYGFTRLDPPIPLFVAGNAPKTTALAGEFGDGVITTGVASAERAKTVLGRVREGARTVGRSLREPFPFVSLTHLCVLHPGETLESERVVRNTGHWVMASFHAIAAGYARPESLPADVTPVYREYEKFVSQMKTPRGERYLELHDGHCTYLKADERRFVTPESIRATTIVGSRDAIRSRIAELEKAGLTQLFLNPPFDGYADYLRDISAELIRSN